jgi:hypothetical protein
MNEPDTELLAAVGCVVRAFEKLELYFASAEDTVLAKLDWYRKCGEVSDRQWRDCSGCSRCRQAHWTRNT